MSDLTVDGIAVDVKYKNIKNINISVNSSSKVNVSAPYGTPVSEVIKFVSLKKRWILKTLKRLSERKPLFETNIREGTLVPLWGNSYPVSFCDKTSLFYLKSKNVVLELNRIYRNELLKTAPLYLENHSKKLNVSFNEWRIKNMKTRWGSCNVKDKRIWLNLKLAAFDISCLECVIVHELYHLIEPSHSSAFYDLMSFYFPDWKEAQKTLSSYKLN